MPLIVLACLLLAQWVYAWNGLNFELHMADCENRWVVLRHEPKDVDYQYGFVYVDPAAGFTVDIGGRFTIDVQGKYRKAPDPLEESRVHLKIRLSGNAVVALLPKDAIVQLGLSDPPDWLKSYNDPSDLVTHKIRWGLQYNLIGDSQRALTYLEPAYKENPKAPGLEFELAYVYNALRRHKEAMQVLEPALSRDPKNMFLCKELAFAYHGTGELKKSIDQNMNCISLATDKQLSEKSEMAMNIAHAYQQLGDEGNGQKWISSAKEWAPPGSAVYQSFHPEPEK